MKPRHGLASALAISLLLLSPALPCSAEDKPKPQAPSVSITFRGLAAGSSVVQAKPRHFVPVTVVLKNDGANEVTGKLQAYRTKEPQAGNTEVPEEPLFYQREVTLPRGARRTETLYYFCQDGEPENRLCVAFESAQGTAVVFPKLETHTDQLLALSVTTGDVDHAAKLAGGTAGGQRRAYDIVVKRADALPDRPEGYGPCDLVILSDLDANSLTPAQAKALAAWVLEGGDLLVASSGKVAEGLGGLDETLPLLPVTALEGAPTVEKDLSALEPLASDAGPIEKASAVIRRVSPKPNAEILGGSAELPLIVRGRAGAGQVTYVAFPLASITSWPGSRAILPLAVHAPREDLEPMTPPAPPLEEVLLNLSEALAQAEPPSALIVGPLLILYIALVVPLNYVVLSRVGKRDYAVLSAGAIALVFGALFYGIGWVYKGTKALVARAAIVELASEKGQASRIDAMTGFFSTDRGVVDGRAPKGSSLAPIYERGTVRGATIVEPAGGDPYLRAVDLDTWALRRFRSVRHADVGAVTAVDLHLDEHDRLVGTIRNDTRWRIEAPTIFLHGYIFQLPKDLAPGESFACNFTTTGAFASPTLQLNIAARLVEGVGAGSYKGRYGDAFASITDPYRDQPLQRLRATLERRAATALGGPDSIPALFAGVVEGDPGGVELDMQGALEVQRSLVLTDIRVQERTPDREIRLVNVPPRVVRSGAYEATVGSPGSPARLVPTANLPQAYVVYEWRVPASRELPFRPKKLTFSWRFADEPTQESTWLRVYDWGRLGLGGSFRDCDIAATKSGPYIVTKSGMAVEERTASACVDPESGVIRYRIDTKGGEISIQGVWLDIEGVRVAK